MATYIRVSAHDTTGREVSQWHMSNQTAADRLAAVYRAKGFVVRFETVTRGLARS